MKKSLIYIALMMSAAGVGFTSCDGELERPPMIEPEATVKPNTTIAALKASVWQTDRNYVTEVGQRNGQDIIIAGRVVSNDKERNVFKNIVLQDETGALTVSINAYDLYKTYHQGQQIVVNMTGLKIGGYNGLLQAGAEGVYNNAPSMTFMTTELFAEHAQQNGLARLERIDTILTTIPELMTAKNSVEGLQKWQSQFIRIDGVSFEDAGQAFAVSSKTSRYVKDAAGNRINVLNSSYAKFADAILPSGTGSIAGILSYFGSDWQIILNDLDGCIGYGDISNPDTPDQPDQPAEGDGDGTEAKPFSVSQVIALNPSDTNTPVKSEVWVKGYIVGSMPTGEGVSTLLSATNFGLTDAATTNVVIGPTADCTDASKCVGLQLPTDMRAALSLGQNPDALGKELIVKGNIAKYCGGPGVKTLTDYVLDGKAMPKPEAGGVFKAVTTVTSGKSYALIAGSKAAKTNEGNYGYINASDVDVTASEVVVPADCVYTITSVSGGYTIQQSDGRYLYMTGTFTSFNFDATAVDGSTWTITPNSDGTVAITNVAMNKTIQFSEQYNSFGSYPDVQGIYPVLYEKVD